MLKTSESTESKTRPGEGRVGVGSDSRTRHGRSGIDDGEVDSIEIEYNEIG